MKMCCMSKMSRQLSIALATAIFGVAGAASASPGELEVHGALDAISASQATVAGVNYAIDSATRFEGANDQPITVDQLAVGSQVELKYADNNGALLALKIELKGSENHSGSGESSHTPAERHKAKLTAASGVTASGSVSSVEKLGKSTKIEAKAKITLAQPLAAGSALPEVKLNLPNSNASCVMKAKGKKARKESENRGGQASSGSITRIDAGLEVSSKTRSGTTKIKGEKKGSCLDAAGQPIAPVLRVGDQVEIKVGSDVVLNGTIQ